MASMVDASQAAVPPRQAPKTLAERLRALPDDHRRAALAALPPDELRALISELQEGMNPDEARRLRDALRDLAASWAPDTDDALHGFVSEECGIRIPRRSVCHGHCAPFDLMADVFFERGLPDKMAVGNRGSGKTNIVGALHAVCARAKPRWSGATVGSVRSQSDKCYRYFADVVSRESWLPLTSNGRVNMGGTRFRNGSNVEVVTGTMTGVNSPHPVMAHFDEVELFRPGVFEEGLNMAQSQHGYRAMNVLTSSWKLPKGLVSSLIDSVERAERDGHRPPYQVYRWCVWEATEPCPHDCDACPFAGVVKGTWEDGSPRSFEDACKRGSPVPGTGKLKHTDGFVPVEDAVRRFRTLSKRMWEAQQESKRPTAEGLVFDNWDEEAFTLDWWDPDPALGPITLGIDFGGTNPHAVGFWQELRHEVHLRDGRVLPEGAHVLFDQVYAGGIGAVEAGKRVNDRIAYWTGVHPSFEVREAFRDPAAKAAALDWARLDSFGDGSSLYDPIPTRALGQVKVEDRVALIYDEVVGSGLLWVDRMRCPDFIDEIGSYERDPVTGRIRDENNHHMDAMGYRFWNLHVQRRRHRRWADDAPRVARRPRSSIVDPSGRRRWDPEVLDGGRLDTGRVRHAGALTVTPRRRGLGM